MEKRFRIREYGRKELACLYCTGLLPDSAWKKFKRFVLSDKRICTRLEESGYDWKSRSFSPEHVRIIVEYFGPPF